MTDKATTTPSGIEPIKDDGFKLPEVTIEKTAPKYANNKGILLQSIAKMKETGIVTSAHLKVMKEEGNDYASLKTKMILSPDCTVPYTDAEIDLVKLKNFFVSKGKMTPLEFDRLHTELKEEKLVKADKGEPEDLGISRVRTIIQDFKAEKIALEINRE